MAEYDLAKNVKAMANIMSNGSFADVALQREDESSGTQGECEPATTERNDIAADSGTLNITSQDGEEHQSSAMLDDQKDAVKKKRSGQEQHDEDDDVESNNSENTDNSDDAGEVEAFGERLEIRQLYSKDDTDPPEYTEFEPAVIKMERLARNHANKTRKSDPTVAIIHYHEVETDKLKSSMIHIQNVSLKSRLADLFRDYPSVDIDAPILMFNAPYTPFIHRWGRFIQAERSTTQADQKRLFKGLRETLEVELEGYLRAEAEFSKTRYIDYNHIVVALEPGEVMLQVVDGTTSAGILKSAKRVQDKECSIDRWKLKMNVIEWDGHRMGYHKQKWYINSFAGLKDITKLGCFPLKAHPSKERIHQDLIERGRKFDSLRGKHIMNYSGVVSNTSKQVGNYSFNMEIEKYNN